MALSVTSSTVVLLLVFLLHTTKAFYSGYGTNEGEAEPRCASATSPCRLRVSIERLGGSEVESNNAQICSCSPPFVCSTNWRKSRHVVSRKVVSTVNNITLQMMFCQPVVPRRICTRGDISLEVKGSMHMPQDISSYNCRCRGPQPLVLHERRFGEDYLTYHAYVCANHKGYCQRSRPCMSIGEESTEYHCKCRGSAQCRTDVAGGYGQPVALGYCTP